MTHQLQVLGYLVGLIGFPDFRWASAPGSALFTVILVDTWVYTPFITILLLAGLRALPREPFEAAELDGVPASFVFFRITLPMLTPYILTAGLFRMLDAIQQFDIIYAMTQGGPGDTLMVFQVQAYLEAFTFTNIGRSAALLMVLWAITFFLSHLFVKHWLRLRERARSWPEGSGTMRTSSLLRPSFPGSAWPSWRSSSSSRSSGWC